MKQKTLGKRVEMKTIKGRTVPPKTPKGAILYSAESHCTVRPTSLRLTVSLTDGRTLSGTYPYLCALSRLEFAAALPNFKDFHMEVAS
jgi:hypothetical protein